LHRIRSRIADALASCTIAELAQYDRVADRAVSVPVLSVKGARITEHV
jgi:hypothetical protein